MSFVVEIPSVFTKPTQIPVRLGNTILTGNETIQGSLSVNGSLTLNSGDSVDNTNVVYYDSLDISNTLNVGGDVSISGDLTTSGNATIGEVPASSTLATSVVGSSLTLNTQPRFMAQNSIDETNSSAGSNIIFDTLVYNIGGGTYDTSTGVYTIGVAGLYEFNFSFLTPANTTYQVDLKQNNTAISRTQSFTSVSFIIPFLTAYSNCEVGDEIVIILTSGKARLFPVVTKFTGMKVA
jgi:hypothetical protein